MAEPWVLAELKSVISPALTTFLPHSELFWIYFNISKLDLYTSEHFVNIFINNLRQGSYSVLPKDGARYVT